MIRIQRSSPPAFFLVLAFLFATSSIVGFAQTREQIKAQAESRLREMTPEEIDRKLKEYGLTREEAIRRAKELNISLDEFLQKPLGGTASDQPVNLPPTGTTTVAPALRVQQSVPDSPRVKTRMPVPGFSNRHGADTLAAFGFEIFQYPPSASEAVLNLASPPSYLLGPGDEVIVTVWGETRMNYQLQVNREGNVIVPEVGPVSANGTTLAEFRSRLLRRMESIYSGLDNRRGNANTFLDVSLGKLRTLQVFVLGQVTKPGGYAISSFGTAFNALYLAGGPTSDGTMREVHVRRKGANLSPIDLYDYVLRGDNSQDHRLQDGDVVFVKPAGKRVAILGSVLRPAIYELKESESLGDLISMAGGLRFDAYFDRIHIERVVPFAARAENAKDLIDIDLRFSSLQELGRSKHSLADGDVVSVFRITNFLQNRVSISGNVNKPGQFELVAGMRIRDVILAADSFQRNTFSERGTLFRMLENLRREVYPFNPRLALSGDEQHNLLLRNEDSIVVYPESQFFPQQTVTIAGAVRAPGTYPRNENMTVADLVVLAGGLREGASLQNWEISTIDTTTLGVYSKLTRINASEDYWNATDGQQHKLYDFDYVFVPFDPRFTQNKLIQITGYVMNPGVYALRYEGERLAEVIARAGEPRPRAYLEGSRFVRRTNNVGTIPLDFRRALEDQESRDNIVLKEGDSIHIAFHDDVVTVSGEVFAPSAILYKKGENVDYYIRQAGGFKQEADESRVVAFLPSGKKWEAGWFFFADPELPPGSTVIVPKEVEKEDKTLPLIRDFATIVASLAALTVALVQVTK
ncbi:MAG: SLBB domain-containing protein [Ignavibacteriae bacterium]|nr:SLBB domain-containing protein [Ignavibacteriota bacterium]